MNILKIIILLEITFGSNFQIEAMFARLTTQGVKVKPPTITRVPSQVPKQDKTIPSPKKTDTSPTSSEKSNQTQDTQTSESKAPKKEKSLYARSSESTQSSDQNAAPKRTIVAAIGDAIASGKQAMAAAWNSLMNSFYRTPSSASVQEKIPAASVTQPIASEKPVTGKPSTSSRKTQKGPFAGSPLDLRRREYSTSAVAAQQPSYWKQFTAFFEKKSPERFVEDLTTILNGSGIKEGRESKVFSDQDLEHAKELIDNNLQFINAKIKTGYYVWEGQTGPRGISIDRHNPPVFNESPLDIIMRRWFSRIQSELSYYNESAGSWHHKEDLETVKNYLKLAQYVANQGGQCLALPSYKKLYIDVLMPQYRKLNTGDLSSIRFTPIIDPEMREIKLLQEVFQELDPLLMQLSSGDKYFTNYLSEVKKERDDIEKDPNAYRQKMHAEADEKDPNRKKLREKEDREKYLKAKRKRRAVLWRYANRQLNWEVPIPDAIQKKLNEVDFIEEEYQDWLKDPIYFIDFHYESPSSYKSHTGFDSDFGSGGKSGKAETPEEIIEKNILKFKELIGVSPTASAEEIDEALKKYRKKYWPDFTPHDLPPKEREEEKELRTKKLQEINDLNDQYQAKLIK